MKKNRKGFTLVEIMIVVAIIGILAAIAIPNFLLSRKRSHQSACIANLKQIQGAKEQYLLAGGAASGEGGSVPTTELFGPQKYIKVTPTCPAGGTYTVGGPEVDPICSLNTGDFAHKLPVEGEGNPTTGNP